MALFNSCVSEFYQKPNKIIFTQSQLLKMILNAFWNLCEHFIENPAIQKICYSIFGETHEFWREKFLSLKF
jgi:hypothetical protein